MPSMLSLLPLLGEILIYSRLVSRGQTSLLLTSLRSICLKHITNLYKWTSRLMFRMETSSSNFMSLTYFCVFSHGSYAIQKMCDILSIHILFFFFNQCSTMSWNNNFRNTKELCPSFCWMNGFLDCERFVKVLIVQNK